MRLLVLLGLASIALTVLLGVDQFLRVGAFFQLRDARHHEFFMALFGAFGLGVLVGTYLR